MKILVPTDFSVIAGYALDAAILLAKRSKSEIHLFHCAPIPDDWEDLPVELKVMDQLNKSIAISARDKLNVLKEKVEAKGVVCEVHYVGGKFLKNLDEMFETDGYDLIVMGSHGVGGKKEWFVGSNTQKVVRASRVNVLVVKEPLLKLDFNTALFVTGLDLEDQIAFQKYLTFLKNFDVKNVHIMTVNTGSFYSQPSVLIEECLKDFKNLAKDFSVSSHFYKDYSIEAAVRHFVGDTDIDLIGISNHVRHPLKRMFQGSNVEMIVNHSKLPVLSIDYKTEES